MSGGYYGSYVGGVSGGGDEPPRFGAPEWMTAPPGVLPGIAPISVELARSDQAVVAMSDVRVYPTGIEFRIRRWWRGDPQWTASWDEAFRIRVEYADGRSGAYVAAELDADEDDEVQPELVEAAAAWEVVEVGEDEEPPQEMVLFENGGVMSEHDAEHDFWLWPLPPPGPVTVVVEWPAFGIAETSVELDGAELADAAARAQRVWD